MSHSDKGKKADTAYYKKHLQVVMEAMAELQITQRDGVLQRPLKLKTTINDACSAIAYHLLEKQCPPIPDKTIGTIVYEWLEAENTRLFAQLQNSVDYDPSAPNRWRDLMHVTFQNDDDCDRWSLMHQIWLIKRNIRMYEVDEKHRPMHLNIYGLPNTGKNLFLKDYLLKPIPPRYRREEGDMNRYLTDERYRGAFGDNLAIVFAEAGKGEKMNQEQYKQMMDGGKTQQRNLGQNTFSIFFRRATIFSTSNRKWREILQDEKPRKCYEITMPLRSQTEMDAYIATRDSINVLDLWKCINEDEDSDLIKNWTQVQDKVLETCAYTPLHEKWILQYAIETSSANELANGVNLARLYNGAMEGKPKGDRGTMDGSKFKAKALDLGFTVKKTNMGAGYYLSGEGYEKCRKRYQNIFGAIDNTGVKSNSILTGEEI